MYPKFPWLLVAVRLYPTNGIFKVSRLVPLKAPPPILVTELGILSEVMSSHSANEYPPMVFSPSGKLILQSFLQL